MARLVFALPGDPDTLTGGYIYDKRLLHELRELGWQTDLLRLGDGFPHPSPKTMDAALRALAAVSPDDILIVDGLAYGALDTDRLHIVPAPIVALVHHPLALEDGLAPERAATLRALEQANLAFAQHVAVTSPHTAATLAADFGVAPNRLTTAPPGIDRPPLPARRPESPTQLLAAGTLIQRKGHDVLLTALSHIQDLDWRMDIVGGSRDTAVAEHLYAQRAALGLEDRVQFRGEISKAEIEALFANADVFALASRYEGYGMVFAEALAWGLPIIACKAGAVSETVPADAGLLTPPDDAQAFADALRRVLTDRPTYERLETGARVAAERLPTWPEAGAAVDLALRAIEADLRP